MNIQSLKEFNLGSHLEHVRSVPVALGKELGQGVAFLYSEAKFLLLEEGKFYKACLHLHTTCSYGLVTPEDAK